MRIQGSGHGQRRRVVRSGCFHLHGGDLAITTTHHRGSLLLPKWTLTIGKTHDWISPGKVSPFLFFFLFFSFLFPPNRRSNTAPILFPAHRRQTDHAAAPAILANVSIRAPRGNIPSGNNPARLRAAERSIPSRDLSFSKYRTTRRWQRS